jgi:hypothetical protein
MPRFPQQLPGDESVLPELDAGFRGVNQRVERGQLQTGYLWDAVNVRMDLQEARTRPGSLLPIHFNHIERSSILGAGIYNDPEGREWMAVCEPRQVWLCADGWQPVSIAIPGGQELTGSIEVIQCGNELRLLRGEFLDTLTWDGNRLIPQFRELASPTGPQFLERQPNASWAVLQGDRLWVPISRDELAWSDILDYNAFDFVTASVRFNQVQDDALVTAVPYAKNRMVVFKTSSIYTLSNVSGDLSELQVDPVSATQGCLARRSVVSVGDDVIYLARGGVYRLSETEQATKLQGVPIPLSYPVPRWMERINWTAAADACACVSGEYYLLAVPVDGSTRNNAVLCYHLPSKEWHSMDFYGEVPSATDTLEGELSEAWAVQPWAGPASVLISAAPDLSLSRGQGFVVTTLFGQQTAFLVDGQRVIALGHGSMDRLGAQRHIQTRLETRGYALGELLSKTVKRVVLQVATRNSSLSMETVTDGVRETQAVLSKVTRNRIRYLRLGRGAFDLSNADSRFNDPYREDYTWLAGDGLRLKEGVKLGDHQDYERAVPLARRGRWLACNITSTQGSLRVIGIVAEGLPSKNHLRTQS